MTLRALLIASLALVSHAALAAPPDLLNKTVRVNWAESLVEKRDDGQTITPVLRHERIIYISGAGRIFSKTVAQSRGVGATRERSPEGGSGASWSFQGRTMSGVVEFEAVARRIVVSFDGAGTSCTATVSVGKRGAHPHWKGVDGANYELLQDDVGSVSCAVSAGNAFAG